ncbi:MAG: PIN domain-containing protein [Ilumatobacteraceae bacterium]
MAARRPPASLGLIYDSGALIAAETDDRRMWALHARALQRGVVPVVPAGCVVEVWRGGQQSSLARLLAGCEVETLDDTQARRAGTLRRELTDGVGAIDATVAEVAIRRAGAVVTSDRSDITRLAVAARRRIQIIDI